MIAGGLKCPVEATELRNQVWVKLMGTSPSIPSAC